MTRLLLIVALFCVAVPAAFAVPPAGKGKPEKSQAASQGAEKKAAKAACKAERALIGAQAFSDKYGTNANKKNAIGTCLSKKAKKAKKADDEDEADDEAKGAAEENAAKKCKAERALDAQAFSGKYGTNHNKRNAFGKCVSKLAKAQGSSS